MKNKIFEYFKNHKTIAILMIVVFIFIISIGIPTLARYRKRTSMVDSVVWDGTIATSYKEGNGTVNNPYVISNGSELAYLAVSLQTTNYDNTYFILENDIVLNDGIFEYDKLTGVSYLLNGNTYYLDKYTNSYYANELKEEEIGKVNLFSSLKNFNGHLNGNAHTIYGLYISSSTEEELAMFTNLTGIVTDLYVDNSLVYGGNVTSGIAANANNAVIKNVYFDGVVVGNENILNKTVEIDLDAIELEVLDVLTKEIEISLPFVKGNIKEIKLTGNIDGDIENLSIRINEKDIETNEFELTLDSLSDLLILNIESALEEATKINFNNLKLIVNYDYANASGIVSNASNTKIENCINKADIYGTLYSTGFANIIKNTEIKNSYNTGKIVSNSFASGIVNNIINTDEENNIINTYNAGIIEGIDISGLITKVLNSNIGIINSFNAVETSFAILDVVNSNVKIENSYILNGISTKQGNVDGSFAIAGIDSLKNKDTMVDVLNFLEFVDLINLEDNENAVWFYEKDSLPLLYIDDETKPVANIFLSKYVWSNLGYDLNNIILNSNIVFGIKTTDELKPLKSIEYYVHNSTIPLNKNEIESIELWNNYDSVKTISDEGFHIIYAKVIDSDNNISYLNTDLLVLDLSGALININLNDKNWSTNSNSINKYYINTNSKVSVEASDMLSGVASLKYYISNVVLTTEELNNLNESNWINYVNPIDINKNDRKIIYVKATDNAKFVSYANTDYIIYNGYNIGNIILGRNTNNSLDNVYITDKSSVSLEFGYNDEFGYLEGYTHNLISNTLLPINTELVLLDKINNLVYKYKIETEEDIYGYSTNGYATIPLTLFKNTKVSVDEYFKESIYNKASNINEFFKLTIDFNNTSLDKNYDNIKFAMVIKDSNDNIVINTINDTIKTFNVYSNVNDIDTYSTSYLNLNYGTGPIIYNSESSTDIMIYTGLNYKLNNGIKIFDTIYEDMNMGLTLKMVNNNGEVIGKKHLKNMLIKIDDREYSADNDGIYHIDLNSGVDNISKVMKLIITEDNLKLPLGEYKFVISNYIAYDGKYTSNESSNEVEIPVLITNTNLNVKYSFNVLMDDSTRIIDKNSGGNKISFSIIQNGELISPNIRISLYKKNELTAYNQDYSLVDIKDYITNPLIESLNDKYYLSTNPIIYNGTSASYNNFELDLINEKFDNTGYKLVFDLYDSDIKIGTIEKKIIIK